MVALREAFLALIDRKPYGEKLIGGITGLAKVRYRTSVRRCAGKADLLKCVRLRRSEALRADAENATSISMFKT